MVTDTPTPSSLTIKMQMNLREDKDNDMSCLYHRLGRVSFKLDFNHGPALVTAG